MDFNGMIRYSCRPFPASARATPEAAAIGGLELTGLMQPTTATSDNIGIARTQLCMMGVAGLTKIRAHTRRRTTELIARACLDGTRVATRRRFYARAMSATIA